MFQKACNSSAKGDCKIGQVLTHDESIGSYQSEIMAGLFDFKNDDS